MKFAASWITALCLFLALMVSPLFAEQKQAESEGDPSAISTLAAEYPKNRAGIFIQGTGWIPLNSATPSKTQVKRGLAASISYGAVPAAVVASYAGLHASAQVKPGQVTICICRVISLPGPPLIVKLKIRKDSRELDGGRAHLLEAKLAEAGESDLVPADVTQLESNVWQVRSKQELSAGEYALMLGAQNMAIFPFTVADSPTVAPSDKR